MTKLARIILASLIAVLALVAISPRLYAFDPLDNTCDGSDKSAASSVCQDNINNPGADLASPQNGIIPKIANIIAAVGGLIAVIFIMVNGVTFMTSTGDSAKISKAREGLIYAGIGLAVVVLARVIIAYILRYL
jgi:hypothetical protein